jgi:DNA-binding NarL/FixJ family response regulator
MAVIKKVPGENQPSPIITAVIADDHPMIIAGLRAFFEETDIQIVADAADGAQALAKILAHKPDVAVMDLSMPRMTAIDVLKEIRKKNLAVKVVVLTGTTDEAYLDEAVGLGVNGYVIKDNTMDELGNAIHLVMKGETYLSPVLSGKLLRKKHEFESSFGDSFSLLSSSEKRILEELAQNRSNKEIADNLHISTKTVKNHRAHICEKLNLKGSNALLHFVLQHRENIKPMTPK